MSRASKRRIVCAAAAAAGLMAVQQAGQAATYTWTPTVGATYNWDNSAGQDNWGTGAGGAFPNAASDVANINNAVNAVAQTVLVGSASINATVGVINWGDTTAPTNISRIDLGTTNGSGTFTMDNGGAGAQINHITGLSGDRLRANLVLNENLTVQVASSHNITVFGGITGGAGLTVFKTGTGTMTYDGGAKAFTGSTVVQAGRLSVSGSGTNNDLVQGPLTVNSGASMQNLDSNAIGDSQPLNMSGSWNMGGNNETVGALSGTGTISYNANGTATATLGVAGAQTADFAGVIQSGNGTPGYTFIVNMASGGVQRLSGAAANLTGAVTVTAGRLELNKTPGVDAIGDGASALSVALNGGELRLIQADQINNIAAIALGGGTFNSLGANETAGVLSSSASSIIDFGAGASTLTFASAATLGAMIELDNWDSGVDHLIFTDTTGLAAQLGNITFGAGHIASELIGNEVVPVPEPASLGLLALAGLAMLRRRR